MKTLSKILPLFAVFCFALLAGCVHPPMLEAGGPYQGNVARYEGDRDIDLTKRTVDAFIATARMNAATLPPSVLKVAEEVRLTAPDIIATAAQTWDAYSKKPDADNTAKFNAATIALRGLLAKAQLYLAGINPPKS